MGTASKLSRASARESPSRRRSEQPGSWSRSWAPRKADQHRAFSRGPVDVLTAVRMAFGGHPSAPLELMDCYALLAPIASVLGSSFAAWERRPDTDASQVLAMLDDAIAFAVQAEDASQEILAAVGAAFARVN